MDGSADIRRGAVQIKTDHPPPEPPPHPIRPSPSFNWAPVWRDPTSTTSSTAHAITPHSHLLPFKRPRLLDFTPPMGLRATQPMGPRAVESAVGRKNHSIVQDISGSFGWELFVSARSGREGVKVVRQPGMPQRRRAWGPPHRAFTRNASYTQQPDLRQHHWAPRASRMLQASRVRRAHGRTSTSCAAWPMAPLW
jgi:hypothetical protein